VTDTDLSHGKEFTGRHMLLLAVAFFGVVIAVNVGMSVLAYQSWTGLVVANSYVASQEFETKRMAHEAQRAAGWLPQLAYVSGLLHLAVLDAAGKTVDLGTVSVLLNRPVGGHDDQVLTLERDVTGAYVAPLTLPRGLWEATVTAPSTALGPFEMRERLRVEAQP
jgi:nitrogen fixation protein FixH